VVITDLGILAPDPLTSEFTLVALHAGVTVEEARAATGWELKIAEHLEETPEPTVEELATLRDLMARTAEAHGQERQS
jgi:glutaconate CoA-transferase subunit B